jgi:hypothetical protein
MNNWILKYFLWLMYKMNNWIYHLKDYANENNISYAEAVKDPKCRKQYYDNLGKKQPIKVKKIMKVIKVIEGVEPAEPVIKKVKKVKTEIEVDLKKVKKVKPKMIIKKNANPAELFI